MNINHTNYLDSDLENLGVEMYELISTLFPIHRSITGSGLRSSLRLLRDYINLEICEVPTGTQVFDWQVPKEWQIREAYIEDSNGKRIVDIRNSNLHVVSYSIPVKETMRWDKLKKHVFTLPEHPDWIPYRTNYSQENWGFCLTHKQFMELEERTDEAYHVCIDSSLFDGSLSYGELSLPGKNDEEVVISSHICHPSLANDNLSGVVVATYLAQHLSKLELQYSYRFIFVPATYGAISWLSVNYPMIRRIKHGLVLSALGDSGLTTYKKSRKGNAEIDRIVVHILQHWGTGYSLKEFEPHGCDERQFCSPGINLAVGCLMRTPNGQYPEYHSSADNLDLVQPSYLADSLAKCMAIISILENNRFYVNKNPQCEPQLGKRGLYQAFGKEPEKIEIQNAIQWVLNFSDGTCSLLDIAERSGLPFYIIKNAADLLEQYDLLGTSSKNSEEVS